MPRDGSGNYTLPVGNPVIDGSIIDVLWANPTMADIAVQLNNVLTRDGVLGATAAIKFANGTAAAPSITFSSDIALGFYRVGSNSIGFATAGIARGSISAVGGWDIPAPASGIGFTQSGFAGSDTAVFNGGTSGSFRVTDRGLPYGTSLHNNTGAVTGTTNQYIASGTYTPTITAGINVTAPSASVCQWMRVGNVVAVSGRCFVNITTSTVATTFRVSLPIASNLTGASECCGYGGCQSSDNINFTVEGTAATDDATFSSRPPTNGATNIPFTFTYLIS